MLLHRLHRPLLFLLLTLTMATSNNFFVKMTLAGEGIPNQASFVLRVEPAWAPIGAERFRELVDSKFYDDQRFFRVLDGMYDIWIAQFGISGNPEIQKDWESKGGLVQTLQQQHGT